MRKLGLTIFLAIFFTMFFPSAVFSIETPDGLPEGPTLTHSKYLKYYDNLKRQNSLKLVDGRSINGGVDSCFFEACKPNHQYNHHNVNIIYFCRVEFTNVNATRCAPEGPEYWVKKLSTRAIKLDYQGLPLSDKVTETVYKINDYHTTEITCRQLCLAEIYKQLPEWQLDKIHQVTSYLSCIPDKPITPYDPNTNDKIKLLANMTVSITLCKYISKLFDKLLIESGIGPEFITTTLLSNIDGIESKTRSLLASEKSGGSFKLYYRVLERDIDTGKAIWKGYLNTELPKTAGNCAINTLTS